MITIEDIKKWSKPHPLANVISLKDRRGGRMSRFGNKEIEFSIVGGDRGLYGDFEKTFEVAIVENKNSNFVTKLFCGGGDVKGHCSIEEVEGILNIFTGVPSPKKQDGGVD